MKAWHILPDSSKRFQTVSLTNSVNLSGFKFSQLGIPLAFTCDHLHHLLSHLTVPDVQAACRDIKGDPTRSQIYVQRFDALQYARARAEATIALIGGTPDSR